MGTRTLTVVVLLILAAIAITRSAVAETPAPVVDTPTSVAETPAPVAETPTPVTETPTAVAETPTPVTETPAPVGEMPTSIAGYVIEDLDGNNVPSAGDRGAQTLVELFRLSGGRIVSGTGLLTDGTGRFEFLDVPEGEYSLSVWWSPGFISLEGQSPLRATEGHPHLLGVGISVQQDGTTQFKHIVTIVEGGRVLVTDAEQAAATQFTELVILVRPKEPESLIPYPVRVGQGPLPVGRATLGAAALPSSGAGTAGNEWVFPWLLVALGLSIIGAATAALRLRRGP